MAFWDDIGRNVSNFFGGIFGGNKKKEDEDKNRNQSSGVTPAPKAPTIQNQVNNNGLKVQQPKNQFDSGISALTLPGSQPQKPNTTQPTNPFVKPTNTVNPAQKPVIQVKKPNPIQPSKDDVNRIPGYYVMSPAAQQAALEKTAGTPEQRLQKAKDALKSGDIKRVNAIVGNDMKLFKQASDGVLADKKKSEEDTTKFIGNIPIIGTSINWGTQLAGLYGKATGNKNLEERARNRSNLLTLGMNNEEFNQYDDKTKAKLGTLKNVVTGLGALDILGATSLAKAPIIAGIKEGAKEGLTSLVGKEILKDSLKETGKQYGKNIGVGALVSAGVDPAIQAYVKDGDIDWSSVPSSMLQGGLWAAAIPEFTGKSRLVQKLKTGEKLTSEESRLINDAIKKTGKEAGSTKIEVQQPRQIGVTDVSGEPTGIPVKNNTPSRNGAPIIEVKGDTPGVNQVKVPTADERAAERFAEQPKVSPDRRVDGFTDSATDYGGGFTRKEIMQEYDAVMEAHRNGEISGEQYREAMDVIKNTIPVDVDPAGDFGRQKGAKIEVKQVQDIPVVDKTEVPVGLPETPGTVRATISTDPNAAKTAQAARQTVSLPPEVQAVLDNPRKFSKAQVAAARNQRKLARQMAKTQEQTAEALARIEAASPAAQSGQGFVPTGEFGKSVNGGAYQKANRAAEMAQAVEETANLAPGSVIQTARANQSETGGFNRRDIRNIAALFETKRLERGSPEWQEARQILKEDGTIWGQTGALRNYTMRRNASSDELISRFESKIYRLADDPSKIDSKLFDEVDAAETNFVETRDAAMRAYNQFEANPTSANAKAYHAAQDAADKADATAKQVEYTVAQKALKGNKDVQQVRELEKMAQSADMYQMDAVDASMLSGTGTFVRNFVNAGVSGVEEGLFGRAGARVSSALTKQDVGGGFGRGSISGFRKGAQNVVDASKARGGAAGKNPLEHVKNWATTGNQLGDSIIDANSSRSTLDHYTQMLKDEGYRGRELRDRASVMARQDPNNVTEMYNQAARVAAGLGNGVTRNNKIETLIKNVISDGISGGNPNAATENIAKLITRLTVGFPTAIGRSVVEGGKRFTLGAPTFIRAMATKDPQQRALLVKEGVKQAGTGGLVIPPIFYALGASGAITGSYPDSQEERDRWEREGITENSIKIGNDYYQLPAYLGSWAIPGLFYASLGRNGGDWGAAASDVAKAAPDLLPTGGIDSVLDVVNGRKDIGKYMSQLIPSAVRASTPAGALLNQLAKSLDPTQNDTNSGEVMADTVAKIMSGIPVASNFLPDKTDSEGNVLSNPDPFALALGARSTEQEAGVQQTEALNAQTNSYIQEMNDMGVFSDPNLKAVITDTDDKKIYQGILAGKQVNPGDLEKLQKAMTKGVEADSDVTAYLEREQYETNLAVLNIKRQLMLADPTVKPSSVKNVEENIKRGEIYRDNEIPYELIQMYRNGEDSISLTEWRNMGDPESEDYNPELYQQLWALDEMMAKAGVSYGKGSGDKQKYYAKTSGGRGRGRGGSKAALGSDFGKLGETKGAPSVQAYETIERQSGSVPVIQRQRPNIVHKIGFSG